MGRPCRACQRVAMHRGLQADHRTNLVWISRPCGDPDERKNMRLIPTLFAQMAATGWSSGGTLPATSTSTSSKCPSTVSGASAAAALLSGLDTTHTRAATHMDLHNVSTSRAHKDSASLYKLSMTRWRWICLQALMHVACSCSATACAAHNGVHNVTQQCQTWCGLTPSLNTSRAEPAQQC